MMVASTVMMPAAAAAVDDPVARLEREVAELKAAMAELRSQGLAEERLAEIERRLGLLAIEVENLKVGEAVVTATREGGVSGLGPAASKVYNTERGVSIGGYGEALLEFFDDRRDDGGASGATDSFDLLRGVLYFGYKFDDRFVFNSEIEFEHATTSAGGSVSVEFAYVDFMYKSGFNLRAGLVLLPMGWINELHEPTVFLGATRPLTERLIIPTTWRENGVGAYGDLDSFSYRTYVVNGFDAAGFSAAGLRGGRQKGSRAKAEDFAWVGRFDFEGVPGLIAGVAAFVGDSGQDLVDDSGEAIGVGTTIFDIHADFRIHGWELRGLYARAELDDVASLNRALGYVGSASAGETLEGMYLQAGYDVLTGKGRSSLTPYLRWEQVNTQKEVPEGWTSDPANDQEIFTLGLAYQPIEELIIKVDYQNYDNPAETGVDRFNVSFGYIF
ncbi:MAG: hypothetical protein ACC742_07715 [Thermoanaerobaculales bacterium]